METLTKDEIKQITKNVQKSMYIGYGDYDEQFKQVFIDNNPTSYIISSHGRLFNSNYHGIKNNFQRMTTRLDKDGYEVSIVTINGKSKTVKIHRLVAIAFIKNHDNKPEVNHIDGVKINNGIWNLEWVTGKENIRHAYKIGLHIPLKGEQIHSSIYTEDTIINICEMLQQNRSFTEISEKLNVTKFAIHFVLRKKRWKHIANRYNFDDYCFGKDVDKIKHICELLELGNHTPTQIAEITDCNVKLVYSIRSGHSYRNISKRYDFSKYNKV